MEATGDRYRAVTRVTTVLNSAASSDVFGAEKAHERLPAVRTEEDDVVPLGCPSFHSRRSGGHTGDSQSSGGRPFFQKLSYGNCRHVSFQDISLDLGSVACGEIRRNSKPFPDDLKVSALLDRDGEARGLKMLYPTCTAPTNRILVNQNVGSLGEGRRLRHD